MKDQVCPKCGEENLADAVMCWACYTPLGTPPREVKPQPTATEKARPALADAWPYLLLGAFTANGWLPRRARWPVLGACLATVGALFGEQKWRQRKVTASIETQLEPVVRFTHIFLVHANQAEATAMRLHENGRGVRGSLLIAGEWQETTRLPIELWFSMRHLLHQYARNGEIQAAEHLDGTRMAPAFRLTQISADLKTGATGETLELQFESAPPKSAETPIKLAPDKRCCKCRELNAPGAVWCWNCYANLDEPRVAPWKSSIEQIAMLSVLSALGSSGWWPRRNRPFVLGAGALGLAAAFAWCPMQEHFKDFKIERKNKTIELPVTRVVNLILSRALQARETHIRLRERGNVVVTAMNCATEFDITLPAYVWLALRNSLMGSARQGVCDIGTEKRKLNAELRCDINGETLDLYLEKI